VSIGQHADILRWRLAEPSPSGHDGLGCEPGVWEIVIARHRCANEAYLAVGVNVRTTSYMPGSDFALLLRDRLASFPMARNDLTLASNNLVTLP
jgi:hypothetical protein